MFGSAYQRAHQILLEEAEVQRKFRGVIQGVEFDFTSPSIDPQDWWLPSIVSKPPMGHDGFYIVPTLREQSTLLGGDIANLLKAELESAVAAGKDILRAGDKVTVGNLRIVQVGEQLEFPADREVLAIHPIVTHPDGRSEALCKFYVPRRGNLDFGLWTTSALELLSQRSEDIVEGADDIRDLRHAIDDAREALESRLPQLAEAPSSLLGNFEPILLRMSIEQLINHAVLFGYRQGRAEAKQSMEPLAKGMLGRAEQARRAARTPRLPKRGHFAQSYWAKHPTATVNEVAVAFCSEPGNEADDVKSVSRSVRRYCPPTSPSYARRVTDSMTVTQRR